MNYQTLTGVQINGNGSDIAGLPLLMQATAPITGTGGDFTITIYYFRLTLPS